MRISHSICILALITCTLFAGCQSQSTQPESWHTDEVSTGSQRVLWEVTVLSFNKHGYPTGSGLDPASMVATSGWKYDLQPFRGNGFRERAYVTYKTLENDRYEVRVRVERDVNMDMVRPLDLSYADWENAPDNDLEARLLMLRIKSWIGGGFQDGLDSEE